jgi:hypothetical protein
MKNLVIAPIGNDHTIHSWLMDGSANFDLCLLDYTEKGVTNKPKSKYYYHLKDFKWIMIKQILPNFIDKYDTFYFPDDDIICTTNCINKLFNYFNNTDFQLAQPSLTKNSSYSWEICKNAGISDRKTSHVEVMCPIMTKDTVQKLIHTFDLNKSSWGLDLLWSELLQYKNIGIIDAVKVHHSKKVGSGLLYTKLKNSPHADMNEIIKKYNIKSKFFINL